MNPCPRCQAPNGFHEASCGHFQPPRDWSLVSSEYRDGNPWLHQVWQDGEGRMHLTEWNSEERVNGGRDPVEMRWWHRTMDEPQSAAEIEHELAAPWPQTAMNDLHGLN